MADDPTSQASELPEDSPVWKMLEKHGEEVTPGVYRIPKTSPLAAAAMGAVHGLSAGLSPYTQGVTEAGKELVGLDRDSPLSKLTRIIGGSGESFGKQDIPNTLDKMKEGFSRGVDTQKAAEARAKSDEPLAYEGGDLGGTAALAALTGPSSLAGSAPATLGKATFGRLAAKGAAQVGVPSAIRGAAESEEPDFLGKLKDAGIQGGIGAALGAGSGVVTGLGLGARAPAYAKRAAQAAGALKGAAAEAPAAAAGTGEQLLAPGSNMLEDRLRQTLQMVRGLGGEGTPAAEAAGPGLAETIAGMQGPGDAGLAAKAAGGLPTSPVMTREAAQEAADKFGALAGPSQALRDRVGALKWSDLADAGKGVFAGAVPAAADTLMSGQGLPSMGKIGAAAYATSKLAPVAGKLGMAGLGLAGPLAEGVPLAGRTAALEGADKGIDALLGGRQAFAAGISHIRQLAPNFDRPELQPYAEMLRQALAKPNGQDAFTTAVYTQAQFDPDFQKILHELNNEPAGK